VYTPHKTDRDPLKDKDGKELKPKVIPTRTNNCEQTNNPLYYETKEFIQECAT
jgi:hypothetical protein